MDVYLQEACAAPPLTPESETGLALRIQAGGREAETARYQLVEANLRMVAHVAKRFTNRGIHILDLIQEGNNALLKAVNQFDPARGFRFSTYATWWVRRAMRHAASGT